MTKNTSIKRLKLKGDYQAQVHSGQVVLVVVRQGAGPHERWPKILKESLENDFRQLKDLLKMGKMTAQMEESTYSLSGG